MTPATCPATGRRWEALVRGVFAGNLFDLGAAASAQHYKSNGGGASFASTRDSLVPRPWVIDHLDALVERLTSGRPYGKAVLFVDNAGSDVLLGMLPFARELLRTGAHVVLAANDRPAINDITAPELADCLQRFTGRDSLLDDALSSGRLRVVGNGSHLPVIDLRKASTCILSVPYTLNPSVVGITRRASTVRRGVEASWALRVSQCAHGVCLACRSADDLSRHSQLEDASALCCCSRRKYLVLVLTPRQFALAWRP